MNITKIYDDIIKTSDDNKDLFDKFLEYKECGEALEKTKGGDKLFDLLNRLCKKNRRIMVKDDNGDNLKMDTKNVYYGGHKMAIGINHNGLGTLYSYSGQLSELRSSHFYGNSDSKNVAKEIINTDDFFNRLLKIVDKSSRDNLKKVKTFFSNNEMLVKTIKDNISIDIVSQDKKLAMVINFDTLNSIDDITITKEGRVYETVYEREVARILNNKNYITDREGGLEEYHKKKIDINVESLPLLQMIFDNKKNIIKQLNLRLREGEKIMKKADKENKFLDSILLPLKTCDKL